MKNTQAEMIDAQEINTLAALNGHPWISINGYTCSGKSTLIRVISDKIASNAAHANVYTFDPSDGVGALISEAKKIEQAIISMQKKFKAGVQFRSQTLVVIHEWDALLHYADNRHQLCDAILELLLLSKRKIIFLTATSGRGRSLFLRGSQAVLDTLRTDITLGHRALETARQLWGTADARYLWLLEQKRPCIVSDNNSINVAIVPEIKQESQQC